MRLTISILAAGCLGLWAGPVGATELNALSAVRVLPAPNGCQITVQGSKSPTFTVFRLNDPDRLVVDFSSADASAIGGHHDGLGPVVGIVASQFSDARASVGRVLVSLDHATQYDVRAEGSRVIISVQGGAKEGAGAPTQPPAAPAAPQPAPEANAPAPAAPESKLAAQAPTEKPEAPAAESSNKPEPGDVVASRVDEQPVRSPARHLVSIAFRAETLHLKADGDVAKYELIQLRDPPRLAVDLYGMSGNVHAPALQSKRVRDLRLGAHPDKVRLVMDVVGEMPEFRATRSRHGLDVAFGPRGGEAQVARAEPAPASAPADLKDGEAEIDGKPVPTERAEPTPVAAATEERRASAVEVKDVTFDDEKTGGRVLVKTSGEVKWTVEHPDPRTAVLTLENAHIAKRLERSFDTSALDTPVKMVSTFGVPGDAKLVRVVVAASGAIEDTLNRVPQGLSWRLAAKGVKTEEVAVTQRTAGFASEAPAYAAESAPRQRRHYVGKRVSFEFKDIDIHNLLRVIAEVSKKNIVVADDVRGTVTIRLRNVPWDEALDLILRSKGLGKEEIGNVMRVAPLKELEDEAKSRAERLKAERIAEPLVVQLVPVNYASATDMSARVKEVLSERGNVAVDSRTNVLIIRDIASGIAKARSLVERLDLATPQVLIESRIVEANVTYSKQLGVQWGGQAQAAPGTGNPTGLAFPYSIIGTGGAGGTATGVQTNPNFAVNLPAPVGQGAGGALGLIFGSAGGALNLNLRLSAAENEGVVKTISAPKITTLDNVTAKISQGTSIPFSQTSAAGVNTTFVDARLQLEVTPHITQDGSIHMNINAQNNQPDPSNTGANGQPAIQRKEATTQVLVKDGDTTVIGGIYVRRASTSISDVPWLSKIPLLGFFFKTTAEADSKQELLIFITPRILNRQTVAQNL